MAGTVADGELTAAAASADVAYALATADDEAAIRRLLRDNPTPGAVALSFEREPDYFRGAHLAGADERTILIRQHGRLICMGRCTTRPRWLNGAIRQVGYLGELRLDASVRGRFDLVRRGYRFFQRLHEAAPADFYFTSIATDNARARRVLERSLPGMPQYGFLTGYETLVLPSRINAARSLPPLETADAVELAAFLNEAGAGTHLSAAWTADRLRTLAEHDLPLERFRVVRVAGRIVACAALWDQRVFRQTVIRGYAPGLSVTRPLLNLLSPILGGRRLPAAGSVLAHAFVSPLAAAPGSEPLLPTLIAVLGRFAAADGIEFLTLGFPEGHPALAAIRAEFRGRTYRTRLYQVTWPGDTPVSLDRRPFHPDVALL